jgi:hypothetical protein
VLRSLVLVAAAAASLTTLTACGDGTDPGAGAVAAAVVDQGLSKAQARPPAAVAPGTLSTIADGGPARTRVAFVIR